MSHWIQDIIEYGVGDAFHSVSAGVQRMLTSPPGEEEIEKEIEATFPEPVPLTPKSSFEGKTSFAGVMMESSSSDCKDNLGISENYFSEPEIFELGSGASVEDIEIAVAKTKDLILSCQESTQRRRTLVQRLIQLRLLLERSKEEREVAKEGVQVRQGHQLVPVEAQLKPSSKQFCDRCTRVIWNVLHVAYKCCFCDYQCHGKCVKNKHMKCPSLKFEEDPNYVIEICPENGLSAQGYRCFQCRAPIRSRDVWGEPRLCDYTGRYFCPACHWNYRMTSPARVIHNWDFEERLVSQQARHFLTYAMTRPILPLEDLNPQLFKFVEELNIVKKLREGLMTMKEYLRTCRAAQDGRLLRRLEVRQHFVDSAHIYSLKDLLDLNDGTLIPFLKQVHLEFARHIKEECEACRGKGFICELCAREEVIFPFDDQVSICIMCHASFHQSCFASISVCPRCLRHSSRRLSKQQS